MGNGIYISGEHDGVSIGMHFAREHSLAPIYDLKDVLHTVQMIVARLNFSEPIDNKENKLELSEGVFADLLVSELEMYDMNADIETYNFAENCYLLGLGGKYIGSLYLKEEDLLEETLIDIKENHLPRLTLLSQGCYEISMRPLEPESFVCPDLDMLDRFDPTPDFRQLEFGKKRKKW